MKKQYTQMEAIVEATKAGVKVSEMFGAMYYECGNIYLEKREAK